MSSYVLAIDQGTTGTTALVSGDTDPATAGAPTVSNAGNSPMEVGIDLSPLAHNSSDAVLDDFSVSLGGPSVDIEDGIVWFDSALCSETDHALSLGLSVPWGPLSWAWESALQRCAMTL